MLCDEVASTISIQSKYSVKITLFMFQTYGTLLYMTYQGQASLLNFPDIFRLYISNFQATYFQRIAIQRGEVIIHYK